ncbi:hypothetical protein GBA52_014137 [Prunus armeniaca]|nr:hypothetical protein GBA52_014137 [Prunus armeniaca]
MEHLQGRRLKGSTRHFKNRSPGRAVADLIRRQREREERNQHLREAEWEAGLIFGHGDFREGTISHNSASNMVSFSTRQGDNHAYHSVPSHMQDAEAVGEGLDLNVTVEEQVLAVGGGDSVGEQVVGNIGLGRPWMRMTTKSSILIRVGIDLILAFRVFYVPFQSMSRCCGCIHPSPV